MSLISRFNPGPGFLELWSYWKRPTEHRWPILAVSILLCVGLFSLLAQEKVYIDPPKPEVVYISTFEEGRSDAEIIASNEENQRLQDAIRERQAEADEELRDIYRTIGRYTGVDTAEAEAEADAERAQDAAEREEWRERMLAEGETTDAVTNEGTGASPAE